MESPKSSKGGLLVIIVLLAAFAAAYVYMLMAYKAEGENRAAYLASEADKVGDDRIDADVKVVSADPLKGDVMVRISFTPHGALLAPDGKTLARDLQFYVSSANGKVPRDFKKGARMDPVEATLDLYEGEPMDYPFDSHSAELNFNFEGKDGSGPVPVAVDLKGSVSGLRLDADFFKDSTPADNDIDIVISRASTTKFFSIFIMTAMWLLTLSVLFLVVRLFLGHRKIEIGMFSFLGALLFAFPALRNSQPSTPPIGTLSDFISFFWAEVLIAFCLLAVVLRWLIRGAGGDAQK